MTVILAATWEPRGELGRLKPMVGELSELYAGMIVVMPPSIDEGIVSELAALPVIEAVTSVDWYGGRHHAVRIALDKQAGAIHYCDLDRLIHWVECYPDEIGQVVRRIGEADCLITGRTERAWSTHPRCMAETEPMFSMVFSYLLGIKADFGAGSMGLSRRAAEYVIANGSAEWGWAIDTAWPLMLHRTGFTLGYQATEGLEWESADRYRDMAADAETRVRLAAEMDQDAAAWKHRAYVAHEITRVGMIAAELFPANGKDLLQRNMEKS